MKTKKSSTIFWQHHFLCILISIGFLSTKLAIASEAEICVRAPYAAYIMYVYKEPATNKLEMQGWFRREAGECQPLAESVGDIYYYYADVDPKDLVAQAWKKTNTYWGADESEEGTIRACVPQNAFHRDSDACEESDRIVGLSLHDASKLKRQFLVTTAASKNLGFEIETLEQAAQVARAIKGQILYGQSIGSDPKGTPFRIGAEIEADDIGVFITDVSAGMPADGVLQPGDRIVQVGSTEVKSVYDFIFAVQDIGLSADPRSRNLPIEFWRWVDSDDPPTRFRANLDLAYYRTLDARLNNDRWLAAAGNSFFDSIFWGFGAEGSCVWDWLVDEFKETPKHQRNARCVERKSEEQATLKEMYPGVIRTFDMLGAGFSPRLVLRSAYKQGARFSTKRLAAAMADEAVQGGLTVIGQASSTEEITPPEILKGAILGAGIGAATGILTGK